MRAEIAKAKKRGEAPPDPLPHPDDIVIEPGERVRFRGPVTEEEAEKFEEIGRLRDVLLMQHALDERSYDDVADRDLLDGPGSALLFAMIANSALPPRMQIDDLQMISIQMRYEGMPKRKLLKELFRAWRSLGVRPRRGFVFPPMRFGRDLLAMLYDITGRALRRQREGHPLSLLEIREAFETFFEAQTN